MSDTPENEKKRVYVASIGPGLHRPALMAALGAALSSSALQAAGAQVVQDPTGDDLGLDEVQVAIAKEVPRTTRPAPFRNGKTYASPFNRRNRQRRS